MTPKAYCEPMALRYASIVLFQGDRWWFLEDKTSAPGARAPDAWRAVTAQAMSWGPIALMAVDSQISHCTISNPYEDLEGRIGGGG